MRPPPGVAEASGTLVPDPIRRPQLDHPRASIPLGYRMFFLTSVPFGLVMGLLASPGGLSQALWLGLLSGLTFGTAMTLFLGWAHVLSTTRLGAQRAVLEVRQRKRLSLPIAPPTLHARLRGVFAELGVHTLSIDDEGAGVIAGETPRTLRSWGERLRAEIVPLGSGCEVILSSEPRLAMTLVDYGKNLDNLERITELLQAPPETTVADPVHQRSGQRGGGVRVAERG